MSDSWPAPPRPDEPSDSLVGQALEVERALKALETMDAFRAEAAALRAELQAVRASGAFAGRGSRRRSALHRGRDLPEGAWRLAAECAVIVAVAGVAWAVHLSRVGILLALGGTWLVVAVFEAIASRTPRPAWVQPPPLAAAPDPVPVVAQAAAQAPPEAEPVVAWPSRLEPVEAFRQPEPAPEAEPEAEPEPVVSVADAELDDGPSAGAFAVLAEQADERVELEALVPAAEVEPDGGPAIGAVAMLEEEAELLDEAASTSRRWWQIFLKDEAGIPETSAPRQRWWQLGRRTEEAGPTEAVDQATPAPELEVVGEAEAESVTLSPQADAELEPEPAHGPEEPEPEPGPELIEAPALGITVPSPTEQEPEPVLSTVEDALEDEAETPEEAPVARRRRWQLFRKPEEPVAAETQPEPAAAEPAQVEPEEEPRWEIREETPVFSLPAPVEPEIEPAPLEPAAVAEVEPDGGPAAGAYAMLEEYAELRMQVAAPHQSRWWQLFGDREKPAEREAALIEPVALVEAPPMDAPTTVEAPRPSITLPAASDSDVGWPTRFGSIATDGEPVLETPEPVYSTPDDTAELRAGHEPEEQSFGLLAPAEPENDGPEPEPELYLRSDVEPDGGPSLGAFAVLVEAAERSELPRAEPHRRSRLRQLLRRD